MSCKYDNYEIANYVMLQYHTFCIIMTIATAVLFLRDNHLFRMYIPLGRSVHISLFLQLAAAISYYMKFPYEDNLSNCPELVYSKLVTMSIAYGEIHQTYLLATVLGLQSYQLHLYSNMVISISTLCNILTVFTLAFIAISLTLHPEILHIYDNFFTIFIAFLQFYFIRLSKSMQEENHNQKSMLKPFSTEISIFENLTILQYLPSLFAGGRSVLQLLGGQIGLFYLPRFDVLELVMNEVNTLLFYLKASVIKETSNKVVVSSGSGSTSV